MSTSSGNRRDRDSMLDLPLRDGEPQGQLPFDQPREPVRSRPPRAAAPRRRASRRPTDRRRWLFGLVLVLVALLAAYLLFWPEPPRPSFSADPFVMTKVRVGESGEAETLTITNAGERPLAIAMLSLSGGEAEEFTLVEEGCGSKILEPQESCAARVRFSPTTMGPRQAVLELDAQMPDSPARLALTGEGIAPLMVVDPPTAEFGGQDVGTLSSPSEMIVANEGTAVMEIRRVTLGGAAEADFRLTRNECSRVSLAPGESCRLTLAFAPRAAGSRQAELLIESDAVEPRPQILLQGNGVWTGAAFEVDPQSIEFGSRLVGTGRRTARLQVVNRQATELRDIRTRLEGGNQGFDLGSNSCRGAALAPGESCSVEVRFDAPTEGDFQGMLEISQSRVGALGIDLRGRGVAPRWVLASSSLEFDATRVGSSSGPSVLELRNEGSAAAEVTAVEVEGADAGAFEPEADGCSGRKVEPGSGCSVRLRFRPQREGSHRAVVLLRVEAGAGPQRVALAATATAARLSLDRELADFGQVHRTTQLRTELLLSNPGTATLELEAPRIEGDSGFRVLGGSCSGGQSLPPAGRCTLVVAFAPSVEGRATARLVLEHDGLSGPRELPLAGVGLPPPIPRLLLEETRFDFGPQPIGQRSSIQTVRLRAAGTGNLEIGELSLDGPDAGDFAIVPATCQAAPSLRPGSDCAVGVRFIPTAAGRRSARLVIRHNATPGSSAVELSGEGIGGPQEP